MLQSFADFQQRAEQDPARPMYHFRPLACWMNDPNGTIYHHGYYHLFYQFHPYGDHWGAIHWGHARSRDLTYWEHLPIALFPGDSNSAHCASGCAIINAQGIPMIFYTNFTESLEAKPYEQRVMLGDENLMTWQPHPRNPVFGLHAWERIGVKPTWRDPFIFREAGRTFLILGAETAHSWRIPIYETDDPECGHWVYRGIFYEVSKQTRQSHFLFECPNFTKIGNKWVLLYSPMITGVEYVVGRFSLDTLTFHAEMQGVLDKGFQNETGFYATNMFSNPTGECILVGWIRGFPPQRGWSGCLSLPRMLTLGTDGRPRQTPLLALQQLRTGQKRFTDLRLQNRCQRIEDFRSDQFEALLDIELGDAQDIGLNIHYGEHGDQTVTIRVNRENGEIDGLRVTLSARADGRMKLHLFVDHSVLELFINDGQECLTRIIDASNKMTGIEVFAHNGNCVFEHIEIWNIMAIWQ